MEMEACSEDTCQWREKSLEDFRKEIREQKMNIKIETIIEGFCNTGITSVQQILPILNVDYLMSNGIDDPIHGQFEVHPACEMIIDTPQFQRLRSLKKIGTCHLVFPGASHSRFEHALGVCHLAGKFVRTLRQNQPCLGITNIDVLCVEIGGLCCSLGYGPFSRLYEESFLPLVKEPTSLEKRTAQMFEEILQQPCNKFGNKDDDIRKMLGELYGLKENDFQFIKEIIGGPTILGSTRWPYKGRKPYKSFLYEIVYNKRNYIDAYRWDYLARDCHHLGLKNNFDHLRYIQMARVIEVDGELQICTRDKELVNTQNLFYTRYLLVRTAYNHKVNVAIKMMITEAMDEVKDIIEFKGKQGKTFKLSECHKDMKAYTQLTDNVIFEIRHQMKQSRESDPNYEKIKKAQELIKKVIETRELYTCVFQSYPFAPEDLRAMMSEDDKKDKNEIGFIKDQIIKKLATNAENDLRSAFDVQVINLDFGMKGEDPIQRLKVYSKRNYKDATMHSEKVSRIFSPEQFHEKIFHVNCRGRDPEVLKQLEVASAGFAEELMKKKEDMKQQEEPDNKRARRSE